MVNAIDFGGRPFHFIGIGGIGMSAIAHILVEQKLPVSGSDVNLNHITQRLHQKGVRIFSSQDAANLETFHSVYASHHHHSSKSYPVNNTAALNSRESSQQSVSLDSLESDRAFYPTPSSSNGTTGTTTSKCGHPAIATAQLPQVVCSTAINISNPEYRAALDLGCPIFHRSDVLAALLQHHDKSIAVGGTHGKTTTSSLIAYMLLQARLDPTIVVGGEVDAWGGNARLGQGDYLVAEADESDGSLVKFFPHIGIVTNIELDHPDHYNSLDEIVTIFKQFQEQSTVLIGCLDCPTLRKTLTPDISYALNEAIGADYTVRNVAFNTNQTCATVYERGTPLGTLTLRLLGRHNLSNALAAVAVGRYLNLPFETIAASLATFGGAHRRFEQRGQVANITFLDDYAHHPSELKATLSAARTQASMGRSMNESLDSSTTAPTGDLLNGTGTPSGNGMGDRHSINPNRIIAVFQPHRYSRTVTFLEDFAQAFDDADVVVLTDIYSAGEQNRTGISGKHVAEAIAQYHNRVIYKPTLPEVEVFLKDALESGDLVLFLGAGNINKIIPDLLNFYRQKEAQMVQSSVYGS